MRLTSGRIPIFRQARERKGFRMPRLTRLSPFKGSGAVSPCPRPLKYEGGPRVLEANAPKGTAAKGWRFSAGDRRVFMARGFMIGPGDEFGIDADRWTPLHASAEG
ncbi:hypothetical protein AB1388_32315 [Streptomyces hydrogenans]|uniref:hypothetical protein n=1 Tax=Streptomyces hydrogenans TaxID=1873719 RepID=UPI00345D0291